MDYNSDHQTTLCSLLQMWGLPSELAQTISGHLSQIDNGQQDRLIRDLVISLQKKQNPQ